MLLHWLREAVDGPGKTPETVLPPTVSAIAQTVRLLYGEDLPTTSILATVLNFSSTSFFQEPTAVSAVVQGPVQERRRGDNQWRLEQNAVRSYLLQMGRWRRGIFRKDDFRPSCKRP
ncbi:hypothetical protein Fot_49671 [Forsythia ovata]|uniref:Uncharacterized protein n=1 Tax=Forsythia ovata TaxID=205694 RepID=A0ABD1QCK1_9LAMI